MLAGDHNSGRGEAMVKGAKREYEPSASDGMWLVQETARIPIRSASACDGARHGPHHRADHRAR